MRIEINGDDTIKSGKKVHYKTSYEINGTYEKQCD